MTKEKEDKKTKTPLSQSAVEVFVMVNVARFIAHIYCLFHWSWNVYWTGDNSDKPETIVAAEKNNNGLTIHVQVYPEWLVRKESP